MNDFKNTPASMRYLSARLKPFRRPMFWGSLGLVSLIGLAIYQYWRHPDWLNSNLAEIETKSNISTNDVSNSINQAQLSAEDLAIGAELDNLDLLLKELEQNQTIPLSQSSKSKKSKNSFQMGDRNTIYHRFQEQQKSNVNRVPKPLIPKKNTTNNLVTSPTRNIFKLPNFNSYTPNTPTTPTTPTTQNSTSSNLELIPNPVGRLYLSDRDRLNNTIRPNNTSTSGSVNSVSPINSFSNNRQTTDGNLSSQNNSNFSTSGIRVNTGENNTSITPSPIPYNNSINATPVTPRPAYGQPIYQQPTNQQPTNFNVNPGIVGNQPGNTLPTRFPPSNLSNQQQTQRYYQLTPNNYQLQPQGYNQPNVNSGFNTQPNNSFNSQSNSFSSSGSFSNSQFNNN